MLSTTVYLTLALETEGEDSQKNEDELQRVAMLLPRTMEAKYPKVRINLSSHDYIPQHDEVS